jgi:hypothetical protein
MACEVGPVLEMSLSPPGPADPGLVRLRFGRTSVEVDADVVRDFLTDTDTLMSPGEEHRQLLLDFELALVTASAAQCCVSRAPAGNDRSHDAHHTEAVPRRTTRNSRQPLS